MSANEAIGNTAECAPRTVVSVPIELHDQSSVVCEIISFSNLLDAKEHFAIRLGVPDDQTPIVRVHSECVTGDVFGSVRCDCGKQLQEALYLLNSEGGYLLYLRQEGRGIGLFEKLAAYRLQDDGLDTYSANRQLGHKDDERDYGVAAQMLRALSIEQIRLLSNNPDKRQQLVSCGIAVREQIPTGVFLSDFNHRYLSAKVTHTDHSIELSPEKRFTA